MKLRILLATVVALIVLGFAQKPASVLAQNTTGCENAPAQYLNYRDGWVTLVRIAETDSRSNRLRETPSSSATVLLMMPVGDWLLLTGNPRCANGFRWWPVAIDKNGQTYNGWTADGENAVPWLELVDTFDPRPAATAYALTATLGTPTPTPSGTPGTPAPTTTPNATTEALNCALAPTFRNLFVAGNATQVRVTGVNSLPSNMRLLGSLDSAVVTTIPVGTTFTITGHSRCLGGYRWWPANYQGLTGWVGDGVRNNGANVYYIELVPVPATTPTPTIQANI